MLYNTGVIMISFGLVFAIAVVISLVKNSNSYTILHVSSVTDAMGSAITLFGASLLSFHYGEIMVGLKICFLIALIYICNPITSYIITKILYFYERENIEK